MKLKTLLVTHALVSAGFGLLFVAAPAQLETLYGLAPTSASEFMGRIFGAALLVFAVVTWAARNADPGEEVMRALQLSFAVCLPIGSLVCLHATLTGALNPLGWSVVGLYALYGAGYAYFRFMASSLGAARARST